MRRIDADKLKARLSQTLLDDLVLADVLSIIEDLEKDPEDRASEMLDAETCGYIRGYNDAIKTTFKLMLQYGSDREEEEHER